VADLALKYNVGGGTFDLGTTAITSYWDAYVSMLITRNIDKKFEWGITWLPKGQGKQVSFVWGHTMTITRPSKHPKEAWEFVKYYQSDDAQRILARNFLYPMTKKGIGMVAKELTNPFGKDVAEIMRPYQDTGVIKTIPWWIPGFTVTYEKYLVSFATDVLVGRKSVKQWTDIVQRDLEKEIARKKK